MWGAVVLLCSIGQGPNDLRAVVELEPTLRCSACFAVMKQVYKARERATPDDTVQTSHKMGKGRRTQYKGSELQIAEILDDACNDIEKKYKLAQENWGGHFKIFCDDSDPVELSMCEPPDWYGEDDEAVRYTGVSIRFQQRCREIIGEFEEELEEAIKDETQIGVMRKQICDSECYGRHIDQYKEEERKARKKWRKRTGHTAKQKSKDGITIAGPGQSSTPPLPDDDRGKNGEVDSRLRWHSDTRHRAKQEEAEEKRKKKEERDQKRKEIKEAAAEKERERKRREEETKGLTFKEWQAQQREREEKEAQEEEEQLRKWEERQKKKSDRYQKKLDEEEARKKEEERQRENEEFEL